MYCDLIKGSGLLLLTLLLEYYSSKIGMPYNRLNSNRKNLEKGHRYLYLVGDNSKMSVQELISPLKSQRS